MAEEDMKKGEGFMDIKESIGEILNRIIEENLANKTYSAYDVNNWSANITQGSVDQLQSISTDFKYIINVILMEKCLKLEPALHISSSCLWNVNTDGNVSIKWENDTIYCILNTFAIAL